MTTTSAFKSAIKNTPVEDRTENRMNTSLGNVPVKFDEKGTALINGLSSSIIEPVLSAKENIIPLTK